jgi:hypothetical protein
MNQLQALAKNEDYRWKKKLFSEQGRAQLEKLTLAPWASRRRQESLEFGGYVGSQYAYPAQAARPAKGRCL